MMGWDDASNKQSGMSSAAPDMDRMVYKLAKRTERPKYGINFSFLISPVKTSH